MKDTADQLEPGEIRVTSTTPIMGENGDFELVAKHHSELQEQVIQHRFLWEFATDKGEIVAYSFAWEPGHTDPLTPEADLEVIGYVEQYLEHHGVVVNGVLSEGMYLPLKEEWQFEVDEELEIL